MSALKRAGNLLVELLRELSDQNAYQRYLAARGVPDSPQEWRHFSKHRLAARFGQAKCC
jgi:hypothetical protein